MGFPFLMWNQAIKPYLIAIGVILRASIAVFLGLLSFSTIMILADLSLLSDEQFSKITPMVRALWARCNAQGGIGRKVGEYDPS